MAAITNANIFNIIADKASTASYVCRSTLVGNTLIRIIDEKQISDGNRGKNVCACSDE